MAAPKGLTPDEIIRSSGHSFHSRVVKRLRELGWAVMVSPYYSDAFTDKPREIDIIAERAFAVSDRLRNVYGDVVVRLFIECKYIAAPTVYWFDAKDMERATKRVATDTGSSGPYIGHFFQDHHHLAPGPVVKLSSTGITRGDEGDAMARAINQNLNALIYYRHRGDVVIQRGSGSRTLGRRLTFPIIAVNSFDQCFRTDMDGANNAVPIGKPFQIEVNYAYKEGETSHNEYFLIDVVSFDSLDAFLEDLIRYEVKAMSDFGIRNASNL